MISPHRLVVLLLVVFRLSCLKNTASGGNRQCEPVGWMVVGGSYQWKEVGLYSGPGCHKAQAIAAESEFLAGEKNG
jgi:hypothetical protein